MPLQTIIKEKRKELGLTQEQIAEFLGVSTPAVNKWENGITYPDITLIAPLARLLKTDLNTLLCFHQELTKQEIQLFSNEVIQKIQSDGFENGLNLAKEKIAEYPTNAELIHNLALILDGSMMLFPMKEEEQNKFEKEIDSLYERINQCDDEEIRNSVNFMLAAKYTNRGDLQKAQELIDQLPEPSALNKKLLLANLRIKENKFEEAEVIFERQLLSKASDVWNLLLSLSSCELKANNIETSSNFASIATQFAKLLQFSDYYQLTPELQVAAHNKDANTCISILERLFASMQQPWNITDSFLYQHVYTESKDMNSMTQLLPAIIHHLETDSEFDFIRQNQRFCELLEQYK